jgi:hypothetical protein
MGERFFSFHVCFYFKFVDKTSLYFLWLNRIMRNRKIKKVRNKWQGSALSIIVHLFLMITKLRKVKIAVNTWPRTLTFLILVDLNLTNKILQLTFQVMRNKWPLQTWISQSYCNVESLNLFLNLKISLLFNFKFVWKFFIFCCFFYYHYYYGYSFFFKDILDLFWCLCSFYFLIIFF